jgi:hypothetical protein
MEISSGNSGVQIAIAVQPQKQQPQPVQMEESFTPAPVAPMPSVNTSGQEVGGILNTWA